MKHLKKLAPLAALLAGLSSPAFPALAGNPYRTDVNPALLYWQVILTLTKDSSPALVPPAV